MTGTATVLEGRSIYFVGIKGTGMSALAELYALEGAEVSGSDTEETFYTDEILRQAGIFFHEGFDRRHLETEPELVVYSTAYDPSTHPELLEAQRLGIPTLGYHEALGAFSANRDSAGIAGVHGKSTTTGMAGALVASLELPASVLAGAAISSFGGRPVLHRGDRYFIAETCEYRRHFLSFHPKRIIVTSVEHDHPDFFPDAEAVMQAFEAYARRLPSGGTLIWCADDPGAAELAMRVSGERSDIEIVPYGFAAEGRWRIGPATSGAGEVVARVGPDELEVRLRIPGIHNLKNAVAAMALAESLCRDHHGSWTAEDRSRSIEAIGAYRGSVRRSEVVGERNGIVFMDDYAHHPTAIRTTLAGVKSFYPDRRVIVDFMPHMVSRTNVLFDDFVTAFSDADILVINDIYASAREHTGGTSSRKLFEAISARRAEVWYVPKPEEGFEMLRSELRSGDLFLTMGAGDNWKVGKMLLEDV